MNHHPRQPTHKTTCSPKEINKGVHMLDQFFRPISTTPKNPRGFQKPDNNKDKKPEEVKSRKAVEIKLHQNALPEEFPAIEEYPVTREYHRADSNDYPLHRIGYYWPVNNFIPSLN